MTSQSQSDGAAQVAGDRSRETNKTFSTPPPRTRTMGKPSPEDLAEFAAAVARLPHEDEMEDGMSGDDAMDTVNSLITWARSLAPPQTPGHPANPNGKGL